PPEQSPLAKPPTPPVARGGVKFELPKHLADDLSGILEEIAPSEFALRPAPSPPPPPPPPPEPRAPAETPADETISQRLMVQIRGLVMQLADAQQQISQRDLEIERMREELENAREVRDGEI